MKPSALEFETFSRHGILALRGFLPSQLTASARHSILNELKRLKMLENGKVRSSKVQNLPVFQQTSQLGQMVGTQEAVDRLFTNELLATMNALADSSLVPSQASSQVLLSLPHKEDWSLRNLNWHVDLKVPKIDEVPGLQAFVLVDDVEPRGGATLALAGSHKLHYISYTDNAHGILKKKSDFTSAPDTYREPQLIEGIEVQIIEMAGRAGDVFIMDLRVLHTPSINATRSIRMMATNRFLANALDR